MSTLAPYKPIQRYSQEIEILGHKYLKPVSLGRGVALRVLQFSAEHIAQFKKDNPGASDDAIREEQNKFETSREYEIQALSSVLSPCDGSPSVEEIYDYIPVTLYGELTDFFGIRQLVRERTGSSNTLSTNEPAIEP